MLNYTETENTSQNSYKVTLPQFEGPLDLLLYLIRKRELDIFDIPIATVLDDYLKHLAIMESMNIDIASEFLVLAATMLHIKSRLLLRSDAKLEDEEGSAEQELQKLTLQLLEYEKYKAVANYFETMATLNSTTFKRPWNNMLPEEVASVGERVNVSLYELVKAFNQVLVGKPEKKLLLMDRDRFSIKEGIERITNCFKTSRRVRFGNIFENCFERSECIVIFLALLEMIKLGLTRVIQLDLGEPIFLESTDNLNLE